MRAVLSAPVDNNNGRKGCQRTHTALSSCFSTIDELPYTFSISVIYTVPSKLEEAKWIPSWLKDSDLQS